MIEYFDQFLRAKQGSASSTVRNYMQLRRKLIGCFAYRPAATMTFGDADDFRAYCLNILKIGENTTRKRCSQAATFWRWLQRRGVVAQNIWEDVPKTVGSALDDKPFIEADTVRKILKYCTDPEWVALISLGRWGGLRIPSETFAMEWQDIDWEHGRIIVNSQKTAHQNKPRRTIPLFPELEAPLMTLQESQPRRTVKCFPRLSPKSGNVRQPFQKLIRRAKVEPWPKLWNSLRATRETELAATYPIHVVCEWMGNTLAVANRNYLKATDADFARATAPSPAPTSNAINGDHRDAAECTSRSV